MSKAARKVRAMEPVTQVNSEFEKQKVKIKGQEGFKRTDTGAIWGQMKGRRPRGPTRPCTNKGQTPASRSQCRMADRGGSGSLPV